MNSKYRNLNSKFLSYFFYITVRSMSWKHVIEVANCKMFFFSSALIVVLSHSKAFFPVVKNIESSKITSVS